MANECLIFLKILVLGQVTYEPIKIQLLCQIVVKTHTDSELNKHPCQDEGRKDSSVILHTPRIEDPIGN